MDPLAIEKGPTWIQTALPSLLCMAWLILSITLQIYEYEKAASFFGEFALGAALSSAFVTNFQSAGALHGFVVRSYLTTLDSFADAAFKATVVVLLSYLINWLFNIHSQFWIVTSVALILLIAKTGAAMQSLYNINERHLRRDREKFLIFRSVWLTAFAGVVSLAAWIYITRPLLEAMPPTDYVGVLGLVAGIALHAK